MHGDIPKLSLAAICSEGDILIEGSPMEVDEAIFSLPAYEASKLKSKRLELICKWSDGKQYAFPFKFNDLTKISVFPVEQCIDENVEMLFCTEHSYDINIMERKFNDRLNYISTASECTNSLIDIFSVKFREAMLAFMPEMDIGNKTKDIYNVRMHHSVKDMITKAEYEAVRCVLEDGYIRKELQPVVRAVSPLSLLSVHHSKHITDKCWEEGGEELKSIHRKNRRRLKPQNDCYQY